MGSTPRPMISGSSAAAILGLSEWTTPFVARQRIMELRHPGFSAEHGYAPLEKVDNAAVRWGTAFEDAVVMLTEVATGQEIAGREDEYFSDFMTDIIEVECRREHIASCHIDGMLNSPCTWLYEGKTTMERAWRLKWGTPGTEHIPQSYQVQVQHNMMLTGAERCTLGVLVFPKAPQDWEDMGWATFYDEDLKSWWIYIPDSETDPISPNRWASVLADMGYFHLYHVDANPETQKAMKEAYIEFWQCHIIEMREPEPSNWEDIRRMFTAPVGTVVADKQLAGWLNEYKDIRKEIGESGPLAKRKDQLKTLAMAKCRKMNPVIDDESQEKMIVMSADGHKLASFDGVTFR